MENLPLQFSARGVIMDNDGRILLVRHALHKPWTLPGGHLESGETFQNAMIREAQEELGLVIELIGMVGLRQETGVTSLAAPLRAQVIEYTNERGPQRKYEEFFLARVVSGDFSLQTSEIVESAWKTLDEIRTLPHGTIYEGIREIILGTPQS